MRPAATLLLVIFAVLASACEPTCQDTCRRFYEDEQCDAGPDGLDNERAIEQCLDICSDALQVTGPEVDVRDRRFNPDFVAPLNQTSTLDSEREAAAWMDCVWSFSDDECPTALDDQYCAKIF